MGEAINRLQKIKKARKALLEIMSHSENVIVIHYSCESFYDRSDGASPRVTSIAIRNLASGQNTSFSIHQMAERCDYAHDEIEQYYDELEKQMLGEYFECVRVHQGYRWLHWNMRDINYGFAALEHKYSTLKGNPIHIQEEKLFDLARNIEETYGSEYIGHPRLRKLLERNNISDKDFLTVQEEAEAFESQKYVKLHQSTLRKVNALSNIAMKAVDDTLKTNARFKNRYGYGFKVMAELVTEHWFTSLIVLILTIVGTVISVIALL